MGNRRMMGAMLLVLVAGMAGCGRNRAGGVGDDAIQTVTLRITVKGRATFCVKAYSNGAWRRWIEPGGSELGAGHANMTFRGDIEEVLALGRQILSDVKPGTYYAPQSTQPACELVIVRGGAASTYRVTSTDSAPPCPESVLNAAKTLSALGPG